VTGSEIVDRCRERDPETTPSTVYRTLDVLEELGYVHHSHGVDGREEFHVLPETGTPISSARRAAGRGDRAG
jgi:Fe2+ or Zn2+ uptake regulation protein